MGLGLTDSPGDPATNQEMVPVSSLRVRPCSNLCARSRRLGGYRPGTFLPVTYYASFGRGYQTRRDVQPVWGQYAVVLYEHTPVSRSSGQGSAVSESTGIIPKQ